MRAVPAAFSHDTSARLANMPLHIAGVCVGDGMNLCVLRSFIFVDFLGFISLLYTFGSLLYELIFGILIPKQFREQLLHFGTR